MAKPLTGDWVTEWLTNKSQGLQAALRNSQRRLKRAKEQGAGKEQLKPLKERYFDSLRAHEDALTETRRTLHGGFPLMCSSRQSAGFMLVLEHDSRWACDGAGGKHGREDAQVQLWRRHGGHAQRFRFDPETGHLLYTANEGFALGVSSMEDGGLVRMHKRDDSTNHLQRWMYREETGHVIHVASGKALDLREHKKENGAPLQLWSASEGSKAQLWRVVV